MESMICITIIMCIESLISHVVDLQIWPVSPNWLGLCFCHMSTKMQNESLCHENKFELLNFGKTNR